MEYVYFMGNFISGCLKTKQELYPDTIMRNITFRFLFLVAICQADYEWIITPLLLLYLASYVLTTVFFLYV